MAKPPPLPPNRMEDPMTAEFPSLAALADDYFAGTRRDQGYIVDGVDGEELATLWRECITISNPEQLEALPPETVIKTQGGSIACRHYERVGVIFGDERPFKWSSLESELPGIVLWHPDWNQR